MVINTIDFELNNNHFIENESLKKQIVLASTFNKDMKHYNGWVHRYNGKYKKTTPFTISHGGKIYQHFDPKFQSNYFENLELNNRSIVILLENQGNLTKNIEHECFITRIGDTYEYELGVTEKNWRDNLYWSNFSSNQLDSLLFLVNMLCEEFNLPKIVPSHNTKLLDIDDYSGIIYKSNLSKDYLDITPSWYFKEFKEKLENEKN